MPTIRREDGSQFIIQPYRELYDPEKASTLKKKIRALSKTQGENIRLFKQLDGRIEAVFSREPGFLLGETIWDFLNKPDNLIYCEALPERRQALLVVVMNGIVFLDAKRNFATLIDEFITLATSDEKFDIYVCGDMPLGETSEGGKFVFEQKNVNGFKTLEEPLLQQLPIDENAQLQPLELALSSPILGKPKTMPIIMVAVLVGIILVFWHIFTEPPKVPKLQLYQPKPAVNPYQGYYQALTTPSPRQQMRELITRTNLISELPGWRIANLTYNGNNYSIQLTSKGGSITQAQAWAKMNNLDISLQQSGLSLTMPSSLTNRLRPQAIYPLDQTLALLLDDLNQLIPGKNVSFSNMTTPGAYRSANITINLNKSFIGVLMLIGEELNRFPVTITNIILTPQNGNFSGKISLQVLGD